MRAGLLLVLALAGATPARAQPAPPLPVGAEARPLTLAEAEQRLLANNLAMLAARRGVDLAQAQRLVASSLPPPQVIVGNTSGQFGETRNGAPRGARLFGPTNNVAVGLQVLVERGSKRTLRTRVAEAQIGAAEAQVLDVLRLSLFQLRQAFLAALLARANLEVALANRASLDRTETLLRRQLRDGAIPEGDLLRFQASRLVFESDITTNAQSYASGIAAMAVLLATDPAAFQPVVAGVNPSRPGIPGTARAPERSPAGAASAPITVRTILSPVAFDVRGRFEEVPELGIGREALAQGVASRADVVAAVRQASAASANLALAEAGRSRDVTVTGQWNRTRLSQSLPESSVPLNANNEFALSLSVPILTSRIVRGNIGIAQAEQGQAELLARATMLQARAEFAAAWATYEQSRALLALYTGGALNRAEEAYRSAEMAYVAGGRTLLDVLDALRTLNATRLQANQARQAYLLSLAALEQATGVSGIAPRL